MSEDLYWDADISSWPAYEGLRKMVSINVERAVVDAFEDARVLIVIGDDGQAMLEALGPTDPRSVGSNCEDVLHVDISFAQALRDAIDLYGDEVINAVEAALADVLKGRKQG